MHVAIKREASTVAESARSLRHQASHRELNVYLLDLCCFVPYYNAYLCKGLEAERINVTLASISHQSDLAYFAGNGIRNNPGAFDLAAQLPLKNGPLRRALKFLECCVNMMFLGLRFSNSRPHIIHVQYLPLLEQGLPFELWFLEAMKRLKIPLVYTVHNVLPHAVHPKSRALYQRLYQIPDALIAHTDAARTRLVQEFAIPPERIWVIPHGYLFHDLPTMTQQQAKAQLGYSTQECFVLWQGVIKPYKGLELLLEAWKPIHDRGYAARLVIAGTGEAKYLDSLKRQAEELGILGSVTFDSRFIPVQELPTLFQAADLAVYPHQEITQSGSLLTGIAAGKAIIVADLPAFRETLESDENAVFFAVGDVSALTQGLQRLINNRKLRDDLATNVRVLKENKFSWSYIAKQTRSCYERLLSTSSKVRLGASE